MVGEKLTNITYMNKEQSKMIALPAVGIARSGKKRKNIRPQTLISSLPFTG